MTAWMNLEGISEISQSKKDEREREREGKNECGGEAERVGKRERIPNRLHTVSTEPDAGLKLMNCEIMI